MTLLTWTVGAFGWGLVFLLLWDRWRLTCEGRDERHARELLQERVTAEKVTREAAQAQAEYFRVRMERCTDARLIKSGEVQTLVMQDAPPAQDRRGASSWLAELNKESIATGKTG